MVFRGVEDNMEEDSQWFLGLFDTLPDLLGFARRENKLWRIIWGLSSYPVQEKLRKRCRRGGLSFRYSMPLRHFGPCNQCDKCFTEIQYELENPRGSSEETRKLFLKESQIHAIRIHGGSFTQTQQAFFRGMYEPAD